MKKMLNIAVRLILFIVIINLIKEYRYVIQNIIIKNKYIETNIFEFIKTDLQTLFILCIYLVVIIIMWIKSKYISEKIFDKNHIENINITLDYENVLTLGIIFYGIYLFINSFSEIIFSIINILSRNIGYDKDFLYDFERIMIIGIIINILKLLISIILIKYNAKIIKKIIGNNKRKSNVA